MGDKETLRQLELATTNLMSMRIAVVAMSTYFGSLPTDLDTQLQGLLAAPGERSPDALLGQIVTLISAYKKRKAW